MVYVVAQVKFSPVESIAKYIPEVQEGLRKQYPRLLKGEFKHIRLGPFGAPEVSTVQRFEFQTKDRTCGIVLQPDSLAIHVSQYSTFETFCGRMKHALDVVNSIVGLSLAERIGLRYVDLLRLRDAETLGQYLHAGLLGVPDAELNVIKSLRTNVYQGVTAAGTLVFRLTQRSDGGFLPFDVEPSPLAHMNSAGIADGTLVTILDFDHWREFSKEPQDFSTDSVIGTLWRLHDHTDLAFRAATTDYARQVWGMEQ